MERQNEWEILIEQKDKNWAEENNVFSWSTWESPVTSFDWEYSQEEWAYVLEGEVEVTTSNNTYTVKAGDFVKFAKDLKCHWNVKKAIRKHYTFK